MLSEPKKPLIVISYAHADEPKEPGEGEVKWLSFVTDYLRPAIKHGKVDLWLDRLMLGGAAWEREIEQKFRTCDIFMLLVSPHSLSSDYVVDKELPIIRERQAKGEEVQLYPLVLTPTPEIALAFIRDYNLRPQDGKPLSDFSLNERYRQMKIVADEVWKLIAKSTARKTETAAAYPGSTGDSNSPPDVKQPGDKLNDVSVGRDSARWQRIEITLSHDGREQTLSFKFVSGSEPVEAQTIAPNLDLVAPLASGVSRHPRSDDSSLGRTLFELLVPGELKDQRSDERPRLLILDELSAGFPWELLDDRRPWMSDNDQAPPALRVGIVRQLLQAHFRKDVVTTRARPKALIIGDPRAEPTGMPHLPGAAAEADAIANLLRDTHDITVLIGDAAEPTQIARLLFTEAWDFIHFSGHGVSEEIAGPDGTKRKVTGFVLGGGVVLTPSALGKMPVSPEIFFVNCAFLGAGPISQDGRPGIAANVAVELVKLGTRCVIAAGWAVDHEAAVAFAERFYRGLLWGETFGVATLRARREAYALSPRNNTWAAYQCYGDPDYRLSLGTRAAALDRCDPRDAIS